MGVKGSECFKTTQVTILLKKRIELIFLRRRMKLVTNLNVAQKKCS
jgi:hypothetical protein